MTEHHDNNGRFKKGNSASSLRKNKHATIKDMKKNSRDVFFQRVHDFFTLPLEEFKEKVTNKKASAFDYMLAQAVAKKQFQFITYLVDHAIGRPNAAPIENEAGMVPISTIIRQDGTRVELSLGAREVKVDDDHEESE